MSYNPTPVTAKGFTQLPNPILFGDYSANAVRLAAVLTHWIALHGGKKGGRRLDPSIPLLCQWGHMAESSFFRARQELVDGGALTIESGGGRRIRSIYTLRPSEKPPQIVGGIGSKTPPDRGHETPPNRGQIFKKRSQESQSSNNPPANPPPSVVPSSSKATATAPAAVGQPAVARRPGAYVSPGERQRLASTARGRAMRLQRSTGSPVAPPQANGSMDPERGPFMLNSAGTRVYEYAQWDKERGCPVFDATDSDPMDTTDPVRMWSWVQRLPESYLNQFEREWRETEREHREGPKGRRDWSPKELTMLRAIFNQKVRRWQAETQVETEP